jgi:hypothetical protein
VWVALCHLKEADSHRLTFRLIHTNTHVLAHSYSPTHSFNTTHTLTHSLTHHSLTHSPLTHSFNLTHLRSWPHSQSTKLLMCCSAGSAGPLAAPLLLAALLLLATCVNAPPLLGRDSITATSSLHALSCIKRVVVTDSIFCTYAPRLRPDSNPRHHHGQFNYAHSFANMAVSTPALT